MTDQPGLVPPAEGSGSQTRRLRRRTADRVIGGVAGGIGDYLNIDPLLVRASFVGLMIFGGAGLVLYVVAWVLIPAERREASIVQDWFAWLTARVGSRTAILAVVLFTLAVIWAAGETQPCMVSLDTGESIGQCASRGFGWLSGIEPVTLRDAALLAIIVIVIGFVVLRWRDGSGGRAGSGQEPGSVTASPTVPSPVPAAAEPYHPARQASVAAAAIPRPRSPLGWYAAASALVAVGLLAIVGSMPGLRVQAGQYFGAALAALGLALVVGAWWGRARALILLGLLLLPTALAASFLTVPLDGGFGEQMFRPQTVGELRPSYRLTSGETYLDLSGLSSSQPITIEASVGVGRLVVLVPRDARLKMDARVNFGRLSLFGGRQVGTSLADRVERETGTGPELILNLETGIGEVLVDTAQGGG